MDVLYGIWLIALYILFFVFTGMIVIFHIKAPFSPYLIVYDFLFVMFMFILPKIFGKKIWTEENGMKDWYLFSGQVILIVLGYYIVEYVYKI